MPRPLMMPLVRGALVGLVWVRLLKVGQDARTGIAELANIAAAAGADEGVLAWETHDVATACELPIAGEAPCLNLLLATRDGHVLHQFPYPDPFGVTAVLMEEDGYRISLTEAFAR